MSTNKEIYQRLYDEYWTGGDVSVMRQYLSPKYKDHALGLKSVEDWEGFMSPFRTGLPDLRFTVHHLIEEGDLVASVWTAEATHTGEFMGMPPTGKKITFTGCCTARFRGGKVVEEWSHPDVYGLMQQVGAIPEPAVA